MRVLLAGATGVIGVPLLEKLVAAGHEVFGTTRQAERAAALERAGATPVVCDVLDREGLREAVGRARPNAVIHQLTALPNRIHPRKVKTLLAATNRLRTEGTRNLIEAGRAAGAERFVAQSIAFAYAPGDGGLRGPGDPLYTDAPAAFADMVAALASLEEQTTGAGDLEGIALRYGFFYGPGTVYAPDGSFAEDVRRRRVPILGSGDGVFSFVHVEDAADATLAALTRGKGGIYNVVDDDPAPVGTWLPAFAASLRAPPPPRVPRWLGRLVGGPYAVYLMCELPGASNAETKEALGWSPARASWRAGLLEPMDTGGDAKGRDDPGVDRG